MLRFFFLFQNYLLKVFFSFTVVIKRPGELMENRLHLAIDQHPVSLNRALA